MSSGWIRGSWRWKWSIVPRGEKPKVKVEGHLRGRTKGSPEIN